MNVRTRIRTYFGKVIAEPIGDEDDIFGLGLVNSLFAMQLLAFVEGEFSIVAEREDLNIRNFCSIAALTAFVEAKLGLAAQPVPGHGSPAH
jgi:acyl carrier protein